MSKWKNNNIVKEIAESMKLMLRLSDNGVAQKPYFNVLLDTLFGNLKNNYELDTTVSFDFFEKSVKETFKENKLSAPDLILHKYDKLVRELHKKEKKYILVTSIELDIELPINRKVNDCSISFYRKIPQKYQKRIDIYKAEHSLSDFKEEKHIVAVVTTSASDGKTAFGKALSALDIIRCIWHMQFNKGFNLLAQDAESKYWTRSMAKLGRFHSLHEDNGLLINNSFFETKNYMKSEIASVNNVENFNKNTSLYLGKIRKSNFKKFIENTIASYISAVDTVELDSRFMKLSSTLEMLCGSDNTKEIIKRATFLYEDYRIEKIILENLRSSRNQHTHAGIQPVNIELKCHQISAYIEGLFKFIIFNPFNAKSECEIHDFLSSAKDNVAIESQIKRLRLVQKFLSSSKSI